MPLALETIAQQLADSGIIAPGKLQDFIPPKAHPASVQELVAELVRQNHLTRFQAAQVAQGKAKSLILGGYTLLDRIGAGGMGQVYKAVHRKMDRIVAIKLLPPAASKDPALIARFEREVRAAARLEHPNIVAAYDADQARGVYFLAMQLVDGQDLSTVVKLNGPLPVKQAVNYTLQAARGLEYAHQEGVVHRDIKPANLLVDRKGVVKILDMGLARLETRGDIATQAELTGTGTVMGTVDYMAPEQALSTKHADGRADIYSLGCSLFYLLTGKPAYGGETITSRLMAHQTQPVPELRQECPAVSPALEVVFRKMVAKKVDERYQTMTQVIADLEGLPELQSLSGSSVTRLPDSMGEATANIAGNPFPAVAPSATLPVRTAARRPRKPAFYGLIAAGVVGAVVLATILISYNPQLPAPAPQTPPEKPVRKSTATAAPSRKPVSKPSVTKPSANPTPANSVGDPDRWPFDPPDGKEYVWSKPESLGLVNTGGRELCPTLTSDECTLVFASNGKFVIARRKDRREPFGAGAVPLPDSINALPGRGEDSSISGDGLLLAFHAGRQGGNDHNVWFSDRTSLDMPFGEPHDLPPPVNSQFQESSPVLSADGLRLCVSSGRHGKPAGQDLFSFYRGSRSAAFSAETNLGPSVNIYGMVAPTWLASDGKTLVNTVMAKQPFEMYWHTRSSPAEPFGPGHVFGPIFTDKLPPHDAWVSADGQRLYFHSRDFPGAGDLDLWMVQRMPKP